MTNIRDTELPLPQRCRDTEAVVDSILQLVAKRLAARWFSSAKPPMKSTAVREPSRQSGATSPFPSQTMSSTEKL